MIICYIYNSMYGGYYAEVKHYDRPQVVGSTVTLIGSYRDNNIANLKNAVMETYSDVKFIRVSGENTMF